jgi:hypothetical protein
LGGVGASGRWRGWRPGQGTRAPANLALRMVWPGGNSLGAIIRRLTTPSATAVGNSWRACSRACVHIGPLTIRRRRLVGSARESGSQNCRCTVLSSALSGAASAPSRGMVEYVGAREGAQAAMSGTSAWEPSFAIPHGPSRGRTRRLRGAPGHAPRRTLGDNCPRNAAADSAGSAQAGGVVGTPA